MQSMKNFFTSFFKKAIPSSSPSESEPKIDINLPLYPSELNIVEREGWGAKPAKFDLPDDPLLPLEGPVKHVFYNDTASLMCDDLAECSKRLQKIQWNHQDGGWPDITHNFLIGTDSTVYVGRGWDWQPDAMTKKLRGNVIDIAFIGNFERLYPLPTMLDAAEILISHGVKLNKISSNNEITWFRTLYEKNFT